MVSFSWKLFHDRIRTKLNLARRNVLPPESSLNFALGDGLVESTIYLSLHCNVTRKIWDKVIGWLDFNLYSLLICIFIGSVGMGRRVVK